MAAAVEERIAKYENFINSVLREDLRRLDEALQRIAVEQADLIQQKHTIRIVTDDKQHPTGFKTQVNIGCNFFMEARVTDTSTVLFDVGLNHFLEMSLAEANKHLDVRIKATEERIEQLRQKSAQTKAHIKLMLLGIGEMRSNI